MTAHQATTSRSPTTTTFAGGHSSGLTTPTNNLATNLRLAPTGTGKGTFAVQDSSSLYIGKYSWLTLLIIIATHKPDTITTNATFSFNGRRLVTSLILVITTIILLVLLVINLDLIKFTEATVNTTSASSSLLSLTTSTSHIVTAATTIIPATATLTAATAATTTTPTTTTTIIPTNATPTTTITTTTILQTTTPNPPTIVTISTQQLKLPPNSTTISSNNNNNNSSSYDAEIILPANSSQPVVANGSANVVVVTVEKSGASIVGSSSSSKGNNSNHNFENNSIDQIQMAATQNNETTTTQVQGSANKTDNSEPTASNGNKIGHQDPCATSQEALDKLSSSPSSGVVNETARYFDIDYAAKTFEDSMVDKNSISLNHYLNGFKELMKFFHSLGTIFLFVTSDLETKIGLLEGYRNTEKGACNPAYLTIQSTIDYETKENLLRDTKRQSGARTILRLHRALEFLSSLMLNLSKLSEDAETAPAAREAYSNTLAKHHPWTIRTIASFAMRTLPHKKTLVESVLGKENIVNETVTNEKMLRLANVTENLFNIVDKFYEENNIKDLP